MSNTINYHTQKWLNKSWYAPQDAYMRALESTIWSKQKFKEPILEIGCSDGTGGELLYPRRIKIDYGVDISPENIKRAKRSKKYKKLFIADAAKLPLDDNCVMTVIINSSLQDIRDDKVVLKEIYRVLKPGGRLLFTVPLRFFFDELKELTSKEEYINLYKKIEVKNVHTFSDWKNLLKKAGFTYEKKQNYLPKKNVKTWLALYRLATFNPYKRELWSYLSDSKISDMVPKNLLIYLEKQYLRNALEGAFDDKGVCVLLRCRK